MRCRCKKCPTYMVQAESEHLGCVCPECGYRCTDCLGTNTVVQKEDLSRLAFDPRFTPEALARAFEDEEGEEQRIEVQDPAPLPEERVIAAEGQARLSAAMEELEPEHRQILTLRVVNDLSYADIAEILGVKEGTVKSRLARAREKLRKNYYK